MVRVERGCNRCSHLLIEICVSRRGKLLALTWLRRWVGTALYLRCLLLWSLFTEESAKESRLLGLLYRLFLGSLLLLLGLFLTFSFFSRSLKCKLELLLFHSCLFSTLNPHWLLLGRLLVLLGSRLGRWTGSKLLLGHIYLSKHGQCLLSLSSDFIMAHPSDHLDLLILSR